MRRSNLASTPKVRRPCGSNIDLDASDHLRIDLSSASEGWRVAEGIEELGDDVTVLDVVVRPGQLTAEI